LAGAVVVESLAGCVVEVSVEVLAAGCVESVLVEGVELAGCAESVAAGDASEEGVAAGGLGRALGLPGVIVSTAAVLPTLEVEAAGVLGCNPNPMVSSPDSLAGVIVGAPLCAAVETSGPDFRTVMDRLTNPGRLKFCSFCIRASAVGSGGGTGTPNFTSLFLASPARDERG